MTDVNTSLIKAYYDAIKTLGYPTYEGEEPDNLTDKVYIVISDVTNTDASTQSTSDTNSSIQVTINTWELEYNTSKTVNTVAGQIFGVIKALPTDTLALAGMQMCSLRVGTDTTTRPVSLAGRKFILRVIIFQQNIFIFT